MAKKITPREDCLVCGEWPCVCDVQSRKKVQKKETPPEPDLGQQYFDRVTKPIELTPDDEALIGKMLDDVRAARPEPEPAQDAEPEPSPPPAADEPVPPPSRVAQPMGTLTAPAQGPRPIGRAGPVCMLREKRGKDYKSRCNREWRTGVGSRLWTGFEKRVTCPECIALLEQDMAEHGYIEEPGQIDVSGDYPVTVDDELETLRAQFGGVS